MERIILHSDINNCYASIECLYHPELAGLPVAVGGDPASRHGIILAKNQLAKGFGVKTGEALWQAREKCPELVVLPPHFDLYIKFSRRIREIYADYTDLIEPFGLDEAWLDITGSAHLFGGGVATAHEIRRRVKAELGITVSIGVSFNKIFAKLGSDYKKPDAVTVFDKGNYRELVWPLPAEELLYVGRATIKKLRMRGVYTIGDIAGSDPVLLKSWLGKWGLMLYDYANGRDSSPVSRFGYRAPIKSIGNSTTTPRDLTSEKDVSIVYYMLAESVCARLRENGFSARTLQISLRDSELSTFERQTRLPRPTNISGELHDAAMELFRQSYDWKKPLRSVGLRGAELLAQSEPAQYTLFDDIQALERDRRLELAVEKIRGRYGYYSIGRAVCRSDSTLKNIDAKGDHIIFPGI